MNQFITLSFYIIFSISLFLGIATIGCGGDNNENQNDTKSSNAYDQTKSSIVVQTDSEGQAIILTNSLATRYLIHVVDQNSTPIPQISVEYFEHDNQSVVHISDSEGKYMEGVIIGNPEDLVRSQEMSIKPVYANHIEMLQKKGLPPNSIDYQEIEVFVKLTDISYGESNVLNAYEASAFYISNPFINNNLSKESFQIALEDLQTIHCSEFKNRPTYRDTTCPPPGSTDIKTIYIFCFYTDSNGNRGWCML